MDNPDWNAWRSRGTVKAWEALLLSFDRNPASFDYDDVQWNGTRTKVHPVTGVLPSEPDEEFKQRLWLLCKALHSSQKYFPDDEHCGFPVPRDGLPLGTFAAWCELEKLDIPPALAKIAKSYGGIARLKKEAAERRKGECVGWWNSRLDAHTYWHQTAVSYKDAAKLLSGHNPKNTKDEDAERNTTIDDTRTIPLPITPKDYMRLRDEFAAQAHNSGDRDLAYWLNVAKKKQLRYHRWIDQWRAEMGIETAGDGSGVDGGGAATEHATATATAQRDTGIENQHTEGEATTTAQPARSEPMTAAKKTINLAATPKRSNAMDAVIVTAKQNAENPNDYHSVWAALVSLAEKPNRPSPLLGYVEGEGVKYQGDSGVKFFTKEALRKRMGRTPANAR